jgi:hypothetical protein
VACKVTVLGHVQHVLGSVPEKSKKLELLNFLRQLALQGSTFPPIAPTRVHSFWKSIYNMETKSFLETNSKIGNQCAGFVIFVCQNEIVNNQKRFGLKHFGVLVYYSLFAIVPFPIGCDIVFGDDLTIKQLKGSNYDPSSYKDRNLLYYIGRKVVAFSAGGQTDADVADSAAFGERLNAALKTGECLICFRNIIYTIINNHRNRNKHQVLTLFSGSIFMNVLSLRGIDFTFFGISFYI